LWQQPRIKFWKGNKCGWWWRVDILIPIHIARCAQTDVCAGIRVTIENQRSIYQKHRLYRIHLKPADTRNWILGVRDLARHRHPLNRKVFKFMHMALKVVLHMCLLG
jgi:hypothetical protein